MILAVASGKGGTGKTTVSASLASVWETSPVCVDMDVEEPNLHLFLNPELTESKKALLSRCRRSSRINAPNAASAPMSASSRP